MMLIEGDSATVQRAVEAAERTISRSNGYNLRANLAPPRPPAVALPASTSETARDADARELEDELLESVAPAPSSQPRPPRKLRTFKVPEILDELRAHEDPDPFKAFVSGHSIDSDIDKALAVIRWLKQKRSIEKFDVRHLHTCFSMVGWALPEDPGSVLRGMKQRGFVRGVQGQRGMFEVTSKGAARFQELFP